MSIHFDLINELRTDKYYLELELQRLYNDNSLPYKDKVFKLKEVLREIVLTDTSISLCGTLFKTEKEETKEE